MERERSANSFRALAGTTVATGAAVAVKILLHVRVKVKCLCKHICIHTTVASIL